ncbi:GNAT family N-acetyltransferase [Paenibacillus tritici]|uniref:GNAT family N-acetyltransferase n=1 Tax=Paenibacillus tritici TaxID=1873425 RepID=A0ABX2DYD9_9BACL|nr:GNAT family protein [Paenibacillus tritici]NQX49360.1 GNAT family N-acetyltransferase [Paenibacillus tritici]
MSARLTLSPATLDDVDYIVDITTSPSLWPFEEIIPTDKEAVKKEVAEKINSDWHKQYVIRLNDPENTPIGELSIHWYVQERDSWELGYSLFPEYRGQGYCTEAAQIALKFAFEEWKAHRVVAMCNEFNTASSRVLDRLGMVREGVFREELFWQDKWVNQYFYAILDREYRVISGK